MKLNTMGQAKPQEGVNNRTFNATSFCHCKCGHPNATCHQLPEIPLDINNPERITLDSEDARDRHLSLGEEGGGY